METADIDELLHRYSHAESRIAANLVELDDHPTYGLLQSGALIGATEARVADAMAHAGRMWTGLDALRRTLERARSLRGSRRLDNEARIELEAILTRPSVLVEVVETPFAERDLLDEQSVERHVTIEELLDEIRAVYEPIRDAVAAIDAVWRDLLPRLDAAETTLGELRAEAHSLDITEPGISQAAAEVTRLRRLVMDDPLSIEPTAGTELDAAVRDAARRIGRLRIAHESLAGDLARTESLVADARALRTRAAVAHAEAAAKIAEPRGLVRVPGAGAIDELAKQAAELRASDAPWAHTRARLDQWLAVGERMVAQLAAAAERNTAPIVRRDELRGLLTAYRAKAAAVGVIERRALAELVDEAHSELYTAPADLVRAERLVRRLAAEMEASAVADPT